MSYSITDIEDMTGISAFTIRYYDTCGLFPDLKRNSRGRREFSEKDLNQLYLIEALRKSGLSIEGIQYYVRLSKTYGTEQERFAILRAQQVALEYQRDLINESLKHIQDAEEKITSTTNDKA